jgi:hypothetical protein
MRTIASACVLMMLAACGNAVTSHAPLFSAADAKGQAQLRSGVWGLSDSSKLPTCKVDTNQPVQTWDSCASGVVVHPGELLGGKAGEPLEVQNRTVLARGAPAVLQVLDLGDHSGVPRYYYAGVQPLKLDAKGRVIELKVWEAMCGPPPPDDPGGQNQHLTDRMFPGLVADQTNYNCVARAKGPVRVSAARSIAVVRQNGGGQLYFRWYRDGDK